MKLNRQTCNGSRGGTSRSTSHTVARGLQKICVAKSLADTTTLSPFRGGPSRSPSKEVVQHGLQVDTAEGPCIAATHENLCAQFVGTDGEHPCGPISDVESSGDLHFWRASGNTFGFSDPSRLQDCDQLLMDLVSVKRYPIPEGMFGSSYPALAKVLSRLDFYQLTKGLIMRFQRYPIRIPKSAFSFSPVALVNNPSVQDQYSSSGKTVLVSVQDYYSLVHSSRPLVLNPCLQDRDQLVKDLPEGTLSSTCSLVEVTSPQDNSGLPSPGPVENPSLQDHYQPLKVCVPETTVHLQGLDRGSEVCHLRRDVHFQVSGNRYVRA